MSEPLDVLRAQWFEEVAPGPWHPAHRPGGPIVLDNANGDSLFVGAPDAAVLVNALESSHTLDLDSPETVTVVEGHNHTTDGLPTVPGFRDPCPQGCDAPLGPTEQVEVTPGRFSLRPRLFVVDPMRGAYALAAVRGQLPADIERAHTLDLDSPETVERLRSAMVRTENELARQGIYVGLDVNLSDYVDAILAALREGTKEQP